MNTRCIGRGTRIKTTSKQARRSREGDTVRIGRVTLYRQHGASWLHIRESREPVCQRVGSAWGQGGAGCGAGEWLPPGIGGSLAGGSRLNEPWGRPRTSFLCVGRKLVGPASTGVSSVMWAVVSWWVGVSSSAASCTSRRRVRSVASASTGRTSDSYPIRRSSSANRIPLRSSCERAG